MKTKTTKIIIPIITALTAVVAIFFAAPYKDWKEWKEWSSSMCILKINIRTSYYSYCFSWWKERFTNTTYNGGILPEVTVTP